MIRLVPFGAPARAELAKVIAEFKHGDPLAPVTVIVPNNYVGLSLRRTLAASTSLVNVRFQVLARLAELLGGASLAAAGRRPLVPWLEAEAIRTALRERPGVFGEVSTHPATARRLAAAARELRELPEAALDQIAAQGHRPADVVRIARRGRELTRDYFDATDLLIEAASVVAPGSAIARETGGLVLYLPRKLPLAAIDLYRAASRAMPAAAIIGLTGDAEADRRSDELAASLGGEVVRQAPEKPRFAGSIASLPDAEEEVRDAIREACRLAEQEGVPLHRIAILYGQSETYGQLVHEVLGVAGIPHNGPPIRTIAQSLAGRAILGLYRAAASGFRRDLVADWMTSAPIRWRECEVPSHRWDEISRDAGVVRGVEQWQRRLEGWAADQEAFGATTADGGESHYGRRARHARELAEFIADLAARTGVEKVESAGDHAKEALGWLESFLPERAVTFPDDEHATEREIEARNDVKALLESMVAIQDDLPAAFGGRFERAQFATILQEALDMASGHAGKLGEGIFVGPVSTAAEMEFDATFMVGLVEGAYPAGAAEDPLLTESERSASGAIASRLERRIDDRRAFLAALAGSGRSRLSMPRSALRDQKTTLPSRWLLESASELAGRPVYASELDELMRNENRPEWFRVEFSVESALREGRPASLQERDLASLFLARAKPDRHFLASEISGLGDGIRARRSRLRRHRLLGDDVRRLDEWNGYVGGDRVPAPSVEIPISPTALETFAACPFRYYLGYVLRVGEVERPEEAETIAAKDLGTIVHDALERFFKEMSSRIDPMAPWSPGERERLAVIAREECDLAERKGLTGRELAWAAQKARILRDLDRFLDYDNAFRAETGFSFDSAELVFDDRERQTGGRQVPAVRYRVDDDTVVAFRGRIDRIDRRADSSVIVTDYKTGGTSRYRSLSETNPFDKLGSGKHLQLPVYALAAKELAGDAPVSAQYWFVSERARFERMPVALDAPTEEAFREIVSRFLRAIRSGHFPPVPGDEDRETWKNCQYCPYDSVCPSSHRLELWNQWKADDSLVEFVELADGLLGKKGGTDAGAS